MDPEQTIAEFERAERIFAAPDTRPFSASDLAAAHRRHDETHSLWVSPWAAVRGLKPLVSVPAVRLGERNCNGDACGGVFKLDTSGKETVMDSFTGAADGGVSARGVSCGRSRGSLRHYSRRGNTDCVDGCVAVFKIVPCSHAPANKLSFAMRTLPSNLSPSVRLCKSSNAYHDSSNGRTGRTSKGQCDGAGSRSARTPVRAAG